MEDKLKELNDYFVGKILSGDFELVEFGSYYVTIQIDGKHNFNLWIANGANYFGTYDQCGFGTNCMALTFTDEQKQAGYNILQSKFPVAKRNTTLKEIEKVKKEYKEKIKSLKKQIN